MMRNVTYISLSPVDLVASNMLREALGCQIQRVMSNAVSTLLEFMLVYGLEAFWHTGWRWS